MTSSLSTQWHTPHMSDSSVYDDHLAKQSLSEATPRSAGWINQSVEAQLQSTTYMNPSSESLTVVHGVFPTTATVDHADASTWICALTSLNEVSILRLLYATVVKRTIDVVVSAMLLFLLFPFLVLAVIAVRMDSIGPAIFMQERVGRGGKSFRLYKFRTMNFNPIEEIAWVVDENGQQRHKVRNDPRITRIGKWLRKTSVDELPQLINILKGDMSLIGPRPELVEIVHEKYEEWQHERHIVRPGLTGWWQVSGRSDLPMHENSELDLYYVRGLSFRLDLLIALKTIRVVFKGIGAF